MGRRPKNTDRGKPELTPLELEMMQVLWRQGDATASEVSAAMDDQRQFAPTTIHTVLGNLRKKGYIEPIPTVERTLRFTPCVTREKEAGKSIANLLGQFFGGSPQRLMAHLIKEGQVDEAELAEIRNQLRDSARHTKEEGEPTE